MKLPEGWIGNRFVAREAILEFATEKRLVSRLLRDTITGIRQDLYPEILANDGNLNQLRHEQLLFGRSRSSGSVSAVRSGATRGRRPPISRRSSLALPFRGFLSRAWAFYDVLLVSEFGYSGSTRRRRRSQKTLTFSA